jgi:hypothetical protein
MIPAVPHGLFIFSTELHKPLHIRHDSRKPFVWRECASPFAYSLFAFSHSRPAPEVAQHQGLDLTGRQQWRSFVVEVIAQTSRDALCAFVEQSRSPADQRTTTAIFAINMVGIVGSLLAFAPTHSEVIAAIRIENYLV